MTQTLPTIGGPADLEPIVYDTWVESELMEAWRDFEPAPAVLSAKDPAADVPALIDFTLLRLRIGARVWSDSVDAYVGFRSEEASGFAGYSFHEMAEFPPDKDFTLHTFVRALCERYRTIVANLPATENDPPGPARHRSALSVAFAILLAPLGIAAVIAFAVTVGYVVSLFVRG